MPRGSMFSRVPRVGWREGLLFAVIAYLVVQQAIPAALALGGPARQSEPLAIGSAFTYQGRLIEDGVPATGTRDMEFRLWNDPTAGLMAAIPLTFADVPIENGLFAVPLAFTTTFSQPLWIEVLIDGASQGRTALTPAPQAIYATFAETAGTVAFDDITGLPAGFADGTDADTLGALAPCSDGQVPEFGAGTWSCVTQNHLGEKWSGSIPRPGSTINNNTNAGLSVHNTYQAQPFVDYGGIGVWGRSETAGIGILGEVKQTGGFFPGYDINSFGGAIVGRDTTLPCDAVCVGVKGFAQPVSGQGQSVGVYGFASTAGVWGQTGSGIGVQGVAQSGIGVYGYASATSASGVYGRAGGTSAVAVRGHSETAGAFAGYFTGPVTVTGTFTNPSDLRLKRDIEPLPYGLAEVRQLSPHEYVLTDDPDGRVRFGLVAQDVQRVMPELVSEDPVSGMLAMNYLDLIPVLVAAIQELDAGRAGSQERMASANTSTGGTAALAGLLALPMLVLAGPAAWRRLRRG